MKERISINQFLEAAEKLEIVIGRIVASERIPKSSKMLKLLVNFGAGKTKVVVTNLGGQIEDHQSLVGMKFPFVTNLEPAKIMGIVSEAMILVCTDGTSPDLEGKPGSILI